MRKRFQKRKSVVVAGYYGFGNAGDELILLSIVRQLRRENPGAPISVFSANPRETAERFEVHAVNRWKPWEWVRPLWDARLFILGGGGLLQESTGPLNTLYYLLLVGCAKAFGCRTEVRALGVDPIERPWNRMWADFILNHLTDDLSVRDVDSQRALEAAGVFHRLRRVPDPVFYLERPPAERFPHRAPRIGWALTAWDSRPGWDHDLGFLLTRVADHLKAVNDLLVFYPEQDEPLARRIGQLATSPATVRVWERPDDLMAWVSEYDLVIGMRYHALVLAAVAGKPFIGWGFQRKIRTLCRDFNQPMWTFERGWDGDAVFRQIGDAWRRREILTERYRSQLNELMSSPAVASESAHIFIAPA